jgi:hypothetical protein
MDIRAKKLDLVLNVELDGFVAGEVPGVFCMGDRTTFTLDDARTTSITSSHVAR